MIRAASSAAERLERAYADAPEAVEFSAFAAEAAALSDDELAELIRTDAGERRRLRYPNDLDRYFSAVPGLRLRPVALDAAISAILADLRARGVAGVEAVETLSANYPDLGEPVREADLLDRMLWASDVLHSSWRAGSTAEDSRRLPSDFGPRLGDGRSRFGLMEILGRGASAVVYRAVDRHLTGPGHEKHVAVKVFRSRPLFSAGRWNPTEEAHAACRVDHPAVARVRDHGVTESGEEYIVSDLVEGGTLQSVWGTPGGVGGIRRACEIVAAVARGLQAVHDAGLVHRDLKPANILMDRTGLPRLTDFGTARPPATEDPAAADRGGLDATGNLAFMAPERLEGDIAKLTARSDVYALGAILYWMLSGDVPGVDAGGGIRRAGFDAAEGLLSKVRWVDRTLARIVGRAMASRPAERHASAQELADDLEAWGLLRPIGWQRPGVVRRVWLWVRRRPAAAAGAAALLAAVSAGAWFAVAFSVARARVEEQNLATRRAMGMLESTLQSARDQRLESGMLAGLWLLEWVEGDRVLGSVADGGRLWSNRVAVARAQIADGERRGAGDDVATLMWRTALGLWLLDQPKGWDPETEAVLRGAADAWARRVGESDSMTRSTRMLAECAAVKRVWGAQRAGAAVSEADRRLVSEVRDRLRAGRTWLAETQADGPVLKMIDRTIAHAGRLLGETRPVAGDGGTLGTD
ncbi:MAG: serine/threonine protein kinase [Phycisphaerales bacterium]|nr:serine/threonine protein kinase [Phycisphaerales bacterium]